MAVRFRFRLPPLMREAAAEFASTFILLVSKKVKLINSGEGSTKFCSFIVHRTRAEINASVKKFLWKSLDE